MEIQRAAEKTVTDLLSMKEKTKKYPQKVEFRFHEFAASGVLERVPFMHASLMVRENELGSLMFQQNFIDPTIKVYESMPDTPETTKLKSELNSILLTFRDVLLAHG